MPRLSSDCSPETVSDEADSTKSLPLLYLARLSGSLLCLLATACAWHIQPPVVEGESARIFVSSYSMHSRLALPLDNHQLVEFGIGDWQYYALRETGWSSALRAAFCSEASALSRRLIPWTEDEEQFAAWSGGLHTVGILVSREAVVALLEELEEIWSNLPPERAYHPSENLWLGRWEERTYRLWDNSNHQTATWLRQLGCVTIGPTWLNRFTVKEPATR